MKDIIVFGAGGHAKAVIDTIEKAGLYRIVGLLDGYKAAGTNVFAYDVLGSEAWLKTQGKSIHKGIIAVGDNWLRANIAASILSVRSDFTFVSAVHPSSSIARGATIGAGTVVMSGAVINSDTSIGEHCVLYPHTSVDHDSSVGSFVTFAPNAVTGGNVKIGDYAVVSIGAKIIHGRSIGEHTVIGAGSTVLTDIPSYSIAYGSPARTVRSRVAGEKYL
ncbi:acetyltransferase [Paenibacillus harenae]|uniref:acetyltransferase n=1 Tax=Paenibacillus harenae TaxID=306543 RepID=UPI00041E5E6B|nr:acetyltransferase [Paenibacillus harenae]